MIVSAMARRRVQYQPLKMLISPRPALLSTPRYALATKVNFDDTMESMNDIFK